MTIIINTVLAGVLIHFGAGIHMVKFVAAVAYVVQPLFLSASVTAVLNAAFAYFRV